MSALPHFAPAPRPRDANGFLPPCTEWPKCICGSIDDLDVETGLCRECHRVLTLVRFALAERDSR